MLHCFVVHVGTLHCFQLMIERVGTLHLFCVCSIAIVCVALFSIHVERVGTLCAFATAVVYIFGCQHAWVIVRFVLCSHGLISCPFVSDYNDSHMIPPWFAASWFLEKKR